MSDRKDVLIIRTSLLLEFGKVGNEQRQIRGNTTLFQIRLELCLDTFIQSLKLVWYSERPAAQFVVGNSPVVQCTVHDVPSLLRQSSLSPIWRLCRS